MNNDKALYWLPRVVGIAFIIFVSLFAMDVFGEYHGWEVLLALFMHLIPSFVLAGILWLAWQKPLIGGGAFLTMSIIFTLFFRAYESIWSMTLITLPLLIIGGLFLWEGLRKERSGKKRR